MLCRVEMEQVHGDKGPEPDGVEAVVYLTVAEEGSLAVEVEQVLALEEDLDGQKVFLAHTAYHKNWKT